MIHLHDVMISQSSTGPLIHRRTCEVVVTMNEIYLIFPLILFSQPLFYVFMFICSHTVEYNCITDRFRLPIRTMFCTEYKAAIQLERYVDDRLMSLLISI